MARRVLSDTINKDQTGFLTGRQMCSNVRNIIDILEYLDTRTDKRTVFMCVDAEKAFDNISLSYMKIYIEIMGFGKLFSQSIETIHQNQSARFSINNEITEGFRRSKGTRQGCPLSPLLFIMVLETLAITIRKDQEIKGKVMGCKSFKIKAFADDFMRTTENPVESLKKTSGKYI